MALIKEGLLEGEDDIHRCDKCGKIHGLADNGWTIRYELWGREIFKGVNTSYLNFLGDYCASCTNELTPYVWELRDIYELHRFNYNLRKAINDKRKQISENNRASSPYVGERRKGCAERRSGHRQGDCFAQAGEEHY